MNDIFTKLSTLAVHKKIHYSLENVKEALQLLGNPQKGLKIVHVAGTNGKGTTCDFIAQFLEILGYKVGVYSSPHLVSYTERIKINGQEISQTKMDELFTHIQIICGNVPLTEFEILTIMAFLYSQEEKVDYLVLETGLGGRLDATNVVFPVITVITTIAMDHMDYLGNSLEQIAKEKIGIVKSNVPLVMFLPDKNVRKMVRERASQSGSKVVFIKSRCSSYLLRNRALARKVVTIMFPLQMDEIRRFSGTVKTRVAGRMQMVSKEPLVFLDSAHNHEGVTSLTQIIASRYGRVNVLYAATRRPDIEEIVAKLQGVSNQLYIAEFDHPRSYRVEEFKSILGDKNVQYIPYNSLRSFIEEYKNESSEILFITGSIYFLGEVMKLLKLMDL